MSNTAASLRHKIASAGELESVVRTMKAMAASSIGQYEHAVRSLDDYNRTVQLGLAACFWQSSPAHHCLHEAEAIGAVVFGSDQGMVGQFNDAMSDYLVDTLGKLPGEKTVWAVGERIQSRLEDDNLQQGANFAVPHSISAITPLIGQVLIEIEKCRAQDGIGQIYLFHHRPHSRAIYTPVSQRLLPLDDAWRRDLAAIKWPTNNITEVMSDRAKTLRALVREYLFVSLFRACAESLASENASRLVAMQRAEKNIDGLLNELKRDFNRLRQNSIDEELFDVVSGFEALSALRHSKVRTEAEKGSR